MPAYRGVKPGKLIALFAALGLMTGVTAMDISVTGVITDRQGGIEYVNPRFSEMTGYSSADVLGQNPRVWQSGTTPLKTYERLWATISAGESWEGEWQNRTRQGRLFWARARISPIRNDRGEITHFVLLMEDISEHKAQEETIWRQANYDSLTALPNRTLFAQRLSQALGQVGQAGFAG